MPATPIDRREDLRERFAIGWGTRTIRGAERRLRLRSAWTTGAPRSPPAAPTRRAPARSSEPAGSSTRRAAGRPRTGRSRRAVTPRGRRLDQTRLAVVLAQGPSPRRAEEIDACPATPASRAAARRKAPLGVARRSTATRAVPVSARDRLIGNLRFARPLLAGAARSPAALRTRPRPTPPVRKRGTPGEHRSAPERGSTTSRRESRRPEGPRERAPACAVEVLKER